MAQSNVIREFLVALGFKTDEAALKKFESGIGTASKAVVGLATAIESTAIAVAVGIARWSSSLEQLYFASLRTGASATNLRAFDRAAQNFGTTAGEALESIEGLARFLRNNPGGEGMLRSLGLQTRDPKTGRMRDTTDMLVDLGRQFAKMPVYLANQYAGMFGISDKTMLALRNGDFSKELEKMRREMQGTGFEKASRDAHQFMMQLRNLQTYVEQFGVQVYDALVKKLGFSMSTITQWLQVNGPMLADRVASAMLTIIDVAEWLGQKIIALVDMFIRWDKATDGWSTRILGFAVALKFLGGAEIIGGILGLGAAFIKLGAAITTATVAGSGGWLAKLLGVGLRGGAVAAAGIGLGWGFDKLFPNNWLARAGNYIGGQLFQHADRFNEAMRRLSNYGWSQEQAAGIVANLNAESGLNPLAVGDDGTSFGIAQWHDPSHKAAFRQTYGHDISEATEDEQYDFLSSDLRNSPAGALIRAQQNAGQVARIMALQYERPAGGVAEAERRAADAVSISQATTIHVNGTSDPAATAKAVASEQRRVNADLTRAFRTTVQ
jgi:hypothetical protein